MRRWLGPMLLGACLAGGLGACGGSEGVGQTASASLAPQVQAVRSAATSGDRDAALDKLGELRATVAQLRSDGQLSDRSAAKVLEAAADAERHVLLLRRSNPAPSTDTEVTPRPQGDDGGGRETKAAEEARKRAEDAAKRAEEEAKKQAEEAKKRVEDAKKD